MESKKGRYYFGDNRPDSEEQEHWLFVKRPGLRPEEVDGGTEDQLKDWKWWLTPGELMEELSHQVSNFKEADAKAFLLGPPPEELDVEMVIRFFCYCHEFRIYPPDWIIEDIHRRFTKWLTTNYKGENRPLDDFFKLPKTKRPDFFRRAKMSETLYGACKMVETLCHYFDFTREDAYEVVSGLLAPLEVTYDSLEKEFKAWKKTRGYRLWQDRNQHDKSDEVKRKWLSRFPPGTFPSHIIEKYPCLKIPDQT